MIRTILYPTDLGLYSSYLLRHVTDMAKSHSAKVVAVHAVEPLGVFADAVLETYLVPEMLREVKEQGLNAVMDAIRLQVMDAIEDEFIDSDLKVNSISDVHILTGNPCDIILEQAKMCGADLIVMGSHSQRGGDDNTLGSVVTKVLQVSKVPVCMVPVAGPQGPH